MFTKANLVSTFVITIWSYFGGYLLWGLMVAPLMEGHIGRATSVWKDRPDNIQLIIGCFIFSFVFSTIYSRLYGVGHKLSRGIIYGAWIGLLLGFGGGMISLGLANFTDLTGTIVNGVFALAFYIVMGILVNTIYNRYTTA